MRYHWLHHAIMHNIPWLARYHCDVCEAAAGKLVASEMRCTAYQGLGVRVYSRVNKSRAFRGSREYWRVKENRWWGSFVSMATTKFPRRYCIKPHHPPVHHHIGAPQHQCTMVLKHGPKRTELLRIKSWAEASTTQEVC